MLHDRIDQTEQARPTTEQGVPTLVEGSIEELRGEDHPLFGSDETPHYVPGREKRSHRHQSKRRNRRRRLVPLLSFVVIIVLVVASYSLVRSVAGRLRTPDYTGSGTGSTRVVIAPGDGADDVAAAMLKAGVVESTRAFINAAKKSGRSGDIQPGTYRVPLHASGSAAMAAILNPSNKLITQVTIPEGYTEKQVLAALSAKTGLSVASLQAAAARIGNLALPEGFQKASSAEGFLFPSTYEFSPGITADEAIQQLTTQFSAEYKKLNLAAAAQAAGVTPYQGVIIASIIESEAKFDADRAKVARVILNRIAIGRPLQIDATSVYAAKLAGLDPHKVIYSEINSPYNSYLHAGLPPTPIANPGVSSLQAGVAPAAGSWLYYVNGDAAGHLAFFTDEQSFLNAAAVCKAKGWGCG
jgi:UPF0755 protein